MLAAPPRPAPPANALSGIVLWGLILLPVVIETLLQAADFGLGGSPLWRGFAYQNGAFWAGLLHDWRPNYPGQPLAMFLSYAVLHDGAGHLAGNMLTLWLLGRRLLQKIGTRNFLSLYLISAIGGGAGFGLLSQSPHPMVGASGALFGLAGAAIWLEATERHRLGITLWPRSNAVVDAGRTFSFERRQNTAHRQTHPFSRLHDIACSWGLQNALRHVHFV